jgi:hypothetical protein
MSATKIAASFRVSVTALVPKHPDSAVAVAWAWCASMLRLRNGVEAESASLRVDRPVYPRRLKHNTVAEGGIDDGPRLARQEWFSDSCPTAASLRMFIRLLAIHNMMGSGVHIVTSNVAHTFAPRSGAGHFLNPPRGCVTIAFPDPALASILDQGNEVNETWLRGGRRESLGPIRLDGGSAVTLGRVIRNTGSGE